MTNNRAENWETVEDGFREHGSVVVSSLGESWGVISMNRLTKKEKNKLLKILEASTDED